MLLGDVITEVRRLSQDTSTDTALQRFSDAELLAFANNTLSRMAVLRPDLFSYIGEIPCADGETLQSAPSDSIRLMEIFRVKDGLAVRETNREVLDQTYPAWPNDAAAAASSWMRHPRHQNKFFIWPKAPASQILIGEYAQTPPVYDAVTEVALLPDAYRACVIDGVMFLSQSVDDEHVLAQRAALFQTSFTQALQANMESRMVTDLEQGGLDKKELP